MARDIDEETWEKIFKDPLLAHMLNEVCEQRIKKEQLEAMHNMPSSMFYSNEDHYMEGVLEDILQEHLAEEVLQYQHMENKEGFLPKDGKGYIPPYVAYVKRIEEALANSPKGKALCPANCPMCYKDQRMKKR